MKKIIKIILIGLMIGCIFHLPYNYYQIMKFISFAGFLLLAYLDYKDKYYLPIFISICGMIVFNPLFRLTFHREIWQMIDKSFSVVLTIWLIAEINYERRKG